MEQIAKQIQELDKEILTLNDDTEKKKQLKQELQDKFNRGDFKTNLILIKEKCTSISLYNPEGVTKGSFMPVYNILYSVAERIEILEKQNEEYKTRIHVLEKNASL